MDMMMRFASNYAKLGSKEREIIEFLYSQEHWVFEGGYSEIETHLSKSPNERRFDYVRAIESLEDKKIICMDRGEVGDISFIMYIGLTSNWQEIVLKAGVV